MRLRGVIRKVVALFTLGSVILNTQKALAAEAYESEEVRNFNKVNSLENENLTKYLNDNNLLSVDENQNQLIINERKILITVYNELLQRIKKNKELDGNDQILYMQILKQLAPDSFRSQNKEELQGMSFTAGN